MTNRSESHKKHIMKVIYFHGEKTATDFHYISNANQYFCDLQEIGLLSWRWAYKGKARVKMRFIPAKARQRAFEFFSK